MTTFDLKAEPSSLTFESASWSVEARVAFTTDVYSHAITSMEAEAAEPIANLVRVSGK